jgi:hypothetical protein
VIVRPLFDRRMYKSHSFIVPTVIGTHDSLSYNTEVVLSISKITAS